MSRVAIVGSCITRDLWPIRGDALEDVLYISRTSLPSLFSSPIRGFEASDAVPEGLGRHQHRAVVWDLQKHALAALVAHRPTHIIFDFIDERFDLLRISPAVATASWELDVSGYRAHPALAGASPISRLSDGCERLWMEAVAQMAAFLRETPLRHAVPILHEARWAEVQVDPDGGLKRLENVAITAGRPAGTAEHNAMLARYDAAFRASNPHVVQVSAPDHRIADASHRWGLSAFHYIPDYYDEIWRQLRALGV